MKIKIPEIEISETTGFDPDLDIFNRRDFGERLANLVENATDSPVIAIDSAWGEGKSTFIKMWRGHIEHHREKKLKSIYFDAFENDHQKDAFLAIASEIYAKISNKNTERKKEFLKVASRTARSLTRGSIKLGVQLATSGIISGSMIDKAEDGISSLLSEQVDEIVDEKFRNIENDKKTISEFKIELEKFSKEEGNGDPIAFIIDELDRCRPDFALDLLEQTKHLFSTNGITFILITNREQLEESIRYKYGPNINATNYLHKFVNIWISLPRNRKNNYEDDGRKFLHYALSAMQDKNENPQKIFESSIDILNEIIEFHRPSFREIERVASYLAIIINISKDKNYYESIQALIAAICYLKACKPHSLTDSKIEINGESLIRSLGLENIKDGFPALEYVRKLIRMDLNGKDERKEILENEHPRFGHPLGVSTKYIPKIISWLTNIST